MPPSNIFMKICRGGLCSGGLKQIYVKDPSQKDSTTRHAQLSLPASCWICFLLSLPQKRNLVTTWCSSISLMGGIAISQLAVSSSTPKNTSFCVGPITLCQLIWNPKSMANCSRVRKACWHSSLVSPIKYTMMVLKPCRCVIRHTDWVNLWNDSGLDLAQKGNWESKKIRRVVMARLVCNCFSQWEQIDMHAASRFWPWNSLVVVFL